MQVLQWRARHATCSATRSNAAGCSCTSWMGHGAGCACVLRAHFGRCAPHGSRCLSTAGGPCSARADAIWYAKCNVVSVRLCPGPNPGVWWAFEGRTWEARGLDTQWACCRWIGTRLWYVKLRPARRGLYLYGAGGSFSYKERGNPLSLMAGTTCVRTGLGSARRPRL